MPKISKKGLLMSDSPIRKLVPHANKAKAAGKKVYQLNIGQPDILSPVNVLEEIRNSDLKVVEYTDSEGNLSYRQKLAEYYKGVGIDIDYNHILVTTGASEAILFALLSCFDPGDEIIIPEPFYANYISFSEASGVNLVSVTTTIEDDFRLPDMATFEAAITSRTRGILICNPGNPTGHLYSKQELERLALLVKKYDLYLFADEVYREFVYDDNEYHSVMNLPGIEQNVVLIDSISKRYSLCGVRIGAFVTRNDELLSTVLKFARSRLSPPTYGQIAAEAALDTPASYFTEVVSEYVKRRDVLIAGLREIPGIICSKPSGAFYTMVRLPVADAEDFCIWMLDSFDLDGETIMMAPANGFYSTPGLGKQEVRIAYVLNVDSLKRSLKILEAGLKAYQAVVTNKAVGANQG